MKRYGVGLRLVVERRDEPMQPAATADVVYSRGRGRGRVAFMLSKSHHTTCTHIYSPMAYEV